MVGVNRVLFCEFCSREWNEQTHGETCPECGHKGS